MSETVQIIIQGTDKASNVFGAVGASLGGVEKSASKAAASLKAFGDRASSMGNKLTMFATLPLAGLAAASIKAASDTAESVSKMNVVFGQSAAVVKKFADTSATSLGMSSQAAIEASATFGNLFLSIGMGKAPAADMSTSLVQLAADLASFNNINTDEALLKLRSGLLGEAEPMRALGVMLTEATVEAKALSMGLVGMNGTLSESAKVQARYALILEQTTTAQGDFARTADGMANQTRIARAELENATAQMGTALLPAATAAAKEVGKLAGAFGDLSPAAQQVAIDIGLVALAAGPTLKVIGALAKGAGLLTAAVGGTLLAAITASGAAFAGAYYAAGRLWQEILPGSPAAKFMDWLDEATNILPKVTENVKDLGFAMDATYMAARSMGRGVVNAALTAQAVFSGVGDDAMEWESSQNKFWSAIHGAQNARQYTEGVLAENDKAALLAGKAWQKAYDDVAEGIKNSIGGALNDASSKLEGLLKGTKLENVPGGNEPGANGPFENIYRAADVAVRGAESPWAKILDITQEKAAEIVNKFRQGLYLDVTVKPLINWDMLAANAETEKQAKAQADLITNSIANHIPLSPGTARIAGAIAAGISLNGTAMATAGAAQGQAFLGGVATALEAQSPSQAMLRLGQDAIEGFTLGLEDFGANRLMPAITAMWASVSTATVGAWNGIGDAIASAVNSIIDVLNGLVKGWNDLAFEIAPFHIDMGPLGSFDFGGFKIDTPDVALLAHVERAAAAAPALAQGGIMRQPGMALVGERGPELLSLPRGAQVAPLPQAAIDYDRLAQVLSMQPITVQIDGERVATIVRSRLQLRGAGGMGR